MSVTVSSTGGVTSARLSGEIDTYTVPDVRAAFEGSPSCPDGRVVVDLRESPSSTRRVSGPSSGSTTGGEPGAGCSSSAGTSPCGSSG